MLIINVKSGRPMSKIIWTVSSATFLRRYFIVTTSLWLLDCDYFIVTTSLWLLHWGIIMVVDWLLWDDLNVTLALLYVARSSHSFAIVSTWNIYQLYTNKASEIYYLNICVFIIYLSYNIFQNFNWVLLQSQNLY